MPRARLDADLVKRVAAKANIKEASVQQQASRLASKLGVPSTVALIIWAGNLGLSTTRALNKLSPTLQAQVQSAQASVGRPPATAGGQGRAGRAPTTRPATPRSAQSQAIDSLLDDDELRDRCLDLLRSKGKYDRVFREATTVLENRLRQLSSLSKSEADTEALVAKALHPDHAILRVSRHGDEQLGFFHLVKGVFLSFRNPYHHQLTDTLSRMDALKFCGLVDTILMALSAANKPK